MKIYREIAKIRQVKRDLASWVSCDINANLFGVCRQYEGHLDIAYCGVCRDIEEYDNRCRIAQVSNWNVYFEGHICNVRYCAKIPLREYVEKYMDTRYSRTRNYLHDSSIADRIGLFMVNELLRNGISRSQIKMWQWRSDTDSYSTIKQFYQDIMCNYLALSAKLKMAKKIFVNEWYVYGYPSGSCKWVKKGEGKKTFTTIPIAKDDITMLQMKKLREDNMSIREISATMGIPKTTVHRKLLKEEKS